MTAQTKTEKIWTAAKSHALLWKHKLIQNPAQDDYSHIEATANWLARAQDTTPDGGVSALYSIQHGWDKSYPETSGYIIPTFMAYARLTGDDIWNQRAKQIGEWLLSISLPEGGWANRFDPSHPVVFDTAQIMLGFTYGHLAGWPDKYISAAEKAGLWLTSIQEKNGEWRKFTYNNLGVTYHSRVAWALIYTGLAAENLTLKFAAKKNLDWVLQQQAEDGWFQHAAFSEEARPSLHTIAYTIRGLLEANFALQYQPYLTAAEKAARAIYQQQRADGSLSGEYGPEWKDQVPWACLTGMAQMCIIWLKLFNLTKHHQYLHAAENALQFLKTTQNTKTKNNGLRGGIWGSTPINGGYLPYDLPNWGAKFFIDALILSEQIKG